MPQWRHILILGLMAGLCLAATPARAQGRPHAPLPHLLPPTPSLAGQAPLSRLEPDPLLPLLEDLPTRYQAGSLGLGLLPGRLQIIAAPFAAPLGITPGDLAWSDSPAGVPRWTSAAKDEPASQGGFLAIRWQAGSLGLTLGGGYTRGPVVASSSPPEGGRLPMSTLAAPTTPSPIGSEAYRRWGAYLAVPYRLGRVGLQPEVSYYRGGGALPGQDPSDEWVLGLQFTFGF